MATGTHSINVLGAATVMMVAVLGEEEDDGNLTAVRKTVINGQFPSFFVQKFVAEDKNTPSSLFKLCSNATFLPCILHVFIALSFYTLSSI